MSSRTIAKLEAVAGVRPFWRSDDETRAGVARTANEENDTVESPAPAAVRKRHATTAVRFEEALAELVEELQKLHRESYFVAPIGDLVRIAYAECEDIFAEGHKALILRDAFDLVLRAFVNRQRRALRRPAGITPKRK